MYSRVHSQLREAILTPVLLGGLDAQEKQESEQEQGVEEEEELLRGEKDRVEIQKWTWQDKRT